MDTKLPNAATEEAALPTRLLWRGKGPQSVNEWRGEQRLAGFLQSKGEDGDIYTMPNAY